MKNKSIIRLTLASLGVLAVAACNNTNQTISSSSGGLILSSSSTSSESSVSSGSSSIPDNHALRFELSEDGTYYSVYSINVIETRDRVIIPSTYILKIKRRLSTT